MLKLAKRPQAEFCKRSSPRRIKALQKIYWSRLVASYLSYEYSQNGLSLKQLRRRISFVIATEEATRTQGDGKDQVGSEKHQPKPGPASLPSPIAPAVQKRADQPANEGQGQRSQ
jgi:hypothetical protein